ncbi:MAG: histidine phosphatase family protein [Gammaproteobacteria bacterium]|nr:histidine phosphatase family protein [Gammaproteobacteria bacterium]NIO26757.1 histidine phosphatase family protein [Gammaproteobacteria bacterium]NIO67313.1 histidine phosphatase family protein [Gammaproteobacteria bacterium]
MAVSGLLLIRHGRTPWNACGRIQGHRDIGLSAAGRAEIAAARVPPEYAHFRWYASPLRRAVQTAELLGARELETDARLMELDWGEWEGWTRGELRARHGRAYAENEARGLDFRPPGGESPAELRVRFGAWLAEVAAGGAPAIAVTHKGVIQMALAMATGWDLTSRAPTRLDWQRGQLFRLTQPAGGLEVARLNVVLGGSAPAPRRAGGEAGP